MPYSPSSSPTPNSLRRPLSSDELVAEIQKRWQEDFEAKKAKWERLSHEQRVKYIQSVFQTFMREFQADPRKAGQDFMQWLISPEGALAWPYIWKPQYRELMIDITSKAYQLALKFLGPGAKGVEG